MFFNPGIAQMGLDMCYGFRVPGFPKGMPFS